MKVKKFDNLWTMGLILCAAILVLIYIAKIFFPEFVVEVAQVESITRIGHYIDTHKWAWYVASTIFSFLSYYFICCASCSKKYLSGKECLIVIGTILALYVIKEFIPNQYTAFNFISMILLPLLFNGKFANTVICFSFINLLQSLTLEIRNIALMVIDFNYATMTILMIDIYIVEVLLYFAFNFEKGVE